MEEQKGKVKPALFGIKNTNRDFSTKDAWGKNVFNNTFPVSLLCYMYSRGINPVYLCLDRDGFFSHSAIGADKVIGADPLGDDVFYSFENTFNPYEVFVSSSLPRIDMVASLLKSDKSVGQALRGIEIKLTAVPDNATSEMSDDEQSSELVIRPDTIVYIALSIARNFQSNKNLVNYSITQLGQKITDWNDPIQISQYLPRMVNAISILMKETYMMQEPLLLQAIWRTNGKSLQLKEHCLDVFIWSDFALTKAFLDCTDVATTYKITRASRSTVWLFRMLYDYAISGKMNHSNIIRNINFGNQTDKAFALSGLKTIEYLSSDELREPRISKGELRNIILGGGHKMLSPERRFDAAIMSSASIFDNGGSIDE